MKNVMRYLNRTALLLSVASIVWMSAPAQATITLADSPLFLTVAVPPNVTVTLDDSGSMQRAYVPELCSGNNMDCSFLDNARVKSGTYNGLYYNPNITYPVAKDANGTALTTSFTHAYKDGFDQSLGWVDLSKDYRPDAAFELSGSTANESFMGHAASGDTSHFRCSSSQCQYKNGTVWTNAPIAKSCSSSNVNTNCLGVGVTTTASSMASYPAYYYLFNASKSGCSATSVDTDSCYDIKFITSSSPATEQQNFANWFTFARTRNLATRTAASLAFADLDSSVRVAWQSLNTCNTLPTSSCKGRKGSPQWSNAIKPFSGTHKSDFYAWLAQLPTANSTPLPAAMKRVGEYYKQSGENSPYDNDLTTSNSGELACRRNYHVMMTDGEWNTALSFGNKDGANTALPVVSGQPESDVTQYTPISPYKDSYSDTLADIAFYYWSQDLRSTLSNNLLPLYRDRTGTANNQYWNAKNDPAKWQHMVNFTIGLGLSGFLEDAGLTWGGDTYSGSYADLVSGTKAWPKADTTANNPANVADLWHAAINSRGLFFNANDPAALSAAFKNALLAISDDSGSSAALSTNSTSVQVGTTVVYQAKFNRDWSGTLLALPVQANGSIGALLWDASTLIPAAASRKIYTYNDDLTPSPPHGVTFSSCSNLSAAEQAALNTNSSGTTDGLCTDRLNWLRGSSAKEQRNSGPFRNRTTTVMGDVINSDPAYVQAVNYGYANLPSGTPGQSTYASYLASNASRTPMVYVGANDGLMHAINATTGAEVFAYLPRGVYGNLSALTDPNYTHRYTTDGPITVGDAYLGSTWKTILVAGLNGGGKTVYALDVTNPDTFDESKVMWEFTDADMGDSFSQPQIGILQDGQWVAVFGNGYNSTGGGSYLYVVDLQTGALLKKIKASDNAGDDNNGLSTPLLFDANGDNLIGTVYAGDLQGNMWKFTLSGLPASWGVAFAGTPLFQARNASNQAQAITAQPKTAGNPLGGTMVVFGTGRYLTSGDVFDTTVQSMYGIRDNGSAVSGRTQLQQQQFNMQITDSASGKTVRSVTNNSVDWTTKKGWYLDLMDLNGSTLTAAGERIISTPLIKLGRAIFTTVKPSTDPCIPGGTSWLLEVDAVSGGTFPNSILDINNDGSFNQSDNVNGNVVGGVLLDGLGMSKTPVWLDPPTDSNDNTPGRAAYKVSTGTSGGFATTKNKPANAPPTPPSTPGVTTRRSWIQIR